MIQKKSDGNMYTWVKVTRHFIGGRCPHECVYCYVPSLGIRFAHLRKRYSGEPRLLREELVKSEDSGKLVFVQSCGDLFAEQIRREWIKTVLDHLCEYPSNTYLLQSKNPGRFVDFLGLYPPNVLFGTTIESNRDHEVSKAPKIENRVEGLEQIKNESHNVMVSIEPVLDFDLEELVFLMRYIDPLFVSIGADSKGHGLPEPSKEKVEALIAELERFTEVSRKSNLERLVGMMIMENV